MAHLSSKRASLAVEPSLPSATSFRNVLCDAATESTSISGPHLTPAAKLSMPYLGIDASRHDYLDATFGVRVAVWRSVVLNQP